VLIGDAVYALQLVRVARGDHYLVGIGLAVPFNSGQLSHAGEEDLVENDGVVRRVVELGHL
jgi:hypothetical protein